MVNLSISTLVREIILNFIAQFLSIFLNIAFIQEKDIQFLWKCSCAYLLEGSRKLYGAFQIKDRTVTLLKDTRINQLPTKRIEWDSRLRKLHHATCVPK